MSFPEDKTQAYHYVGLAGSGMSALAAFQAMKGGRVSGSDRVFASHPPSMAIFRKLGIECFPQDGSGVKTGLDAVVQSTAVEDANPDMARARALSIPVLHRSRVLADCVNRMKTVAVAGTSGKSTVTAMIFDILEKTGKSPSLITGGALVSLLRDGLFGNAAAGRSDLLVVEADESDGSLVEYRPGVGLVLNIEKDHKEIGEVYALFERFLSQSRERILNADQKLLNPLIPGSATFGHALHADYSIRDIRLNPHGSDFMVNGTPFRLNHPGLYNAENALAAAAVAGTLGIELRASAAALEGFAGVSRRFEVVGTKRGIEVIDDFAHNPAKIRAALSAAALRGGRTLAIFQPHGFAPTRFLRKELIAAFAQALRPDDILLMPEIFYAGGTVKRDISSAHIVEGVGRGGKQALFFSDRTAIVSWVAAQTRPGDCVLLMGARDPSLPAFGQSLFEAL